MSTAIERFDFHGDMLDVLERDGHIYVALRAMCSALGVDVDNQRRKLQEKPWAVTVLSTATAPDGKKYEMFCVALGSVPMWLAGIDARRVAAHVRPKLLRFQLECHDVLRDHFMPRRAPAAAPPSVNIFASVARIGDDPLARRDLGVWCIAAAKACKVSNSRIHGFVRKTYTAPGIYSIPRVTHDGVVALLQALVKGEVLLPTRRARLLRLVPRCPAQIPLPLDPPAS